jgi:hypothetical protein
VDVTMSAETIDTESGDTTAALSNNVLDNVPVKGRDVMNLLRTLPGVSQVAAQPWGTGEFGDKDPAGTSSNGGQFGSFTPAIGGARLFWNTVTVDGQVGSNSDFPGLFMAILSRRQLPRSFHNYTADYGRNPGSTINLVSKSGSQDFHGNVYGINGRNERERFLHNQTQNRLARLASMAADQSTSEVNTEKKKLFSLLPGELEGHLLGDPQVRSCGSRTLEIFPRPRPGGQWRVITDPPPPKRFLQHHSVKSAQPLIPNQEPSLPRRRISPDGGNYNFVAWQDGCRFKMER